MSLLKVVFGWIDYWKSFVTNPDFQEKQEWVTWLTKKCARWHQNNWTSLRFVGSLATLAVYWTVENQWWGLVCFVLFALTDWVDGKVARYRNNGATTADGSFLDATADKVFVLPVLWVWGVNYFWHSMMAVLVTIELICNALPSAFFAFRKIIKKDKSSFEHVMVGKYKFALQIVLACLLWLAAYVGGVSIWWKIWLNVLLGLIIILAVFSAVCKFRPKFIEFFPDFLTAGNIICGVYAMIFANNGNIPVAATLIIVASFFDFFDGVAARRLRDKSSKFGAIADDVGDFVSFACAPAYLLYCAGIYWWVCLAYVFLTAARLVYFILHNSGDGIFSGVPSTAVAVWIASLALWGGGLQALLVSAIVCGAFEVTFFLRWYHCRRFAQASNGVKFATALLGTALFFTKGFGFLFLTLSGGYVIFFFKPLADRLWIKKEREILT